MQNPIYRARSERAAHIIVSALIVSATARATTFTWDNAAANLAWDNVSVNWTGLTWPGTGTDNDAVFGATGVGSIAIDAAGISANDLTFNTAGYTLASPGILTLNGATNIITTTAAASISANLAGTTGFTKAGTQGLTLSGNNSGLSGTLTINDVAGTNNNGVNVSSLAALGGVTVVNVGGTAATGGFFRLLGTGIAVPASVDYNLSGQGGATAPAGTLISGGTGINSVAGDITINTNGVRISNSGATRFDITGAITQNYVSVATDQLLFRFADNEGIHLTNTSNSWSVQTVNSQGILWFDPGALPTTTNLAIAASNTGVIQTSGTFNRALGTGANQVQFTLSAGRAMGFGARGADLTLNFGGAGADINFDTNAGAAASNIRTSTLVLNNSTADSKLTLANALNLNGVARTIQVDSNVAELTGGLKNSTGTFALTKTGAGTLIVSGPVSGGTSLTGNGGTLRVTGGISGTGGLTTSSGTTEISGSGANTYSGAVNVNGGNLLIKRSDGLGSTAAGTTTGGAQSQGSLQFDSSGASGGSFSIAENITLGMRASLVNNSSSSMKPNFNNLGGNTTLTGLINGTTGGAVTKISSDGGLLDIAGELRQSGATPTASSRFTNIQGSGNAVVSGLITQAANITHRLDKMGSGTWKFTNAGNTFSGGVRILEGTLEVTGLGNGGAAAAVLGTATNAAANIHINGGTLKYSGLGGENSDRLFTLGAAGGTIDASGGAALNLTNTGAVDVANGGGTGIQYSFASGTTTIATNDTTLLKAGMDIGGVAGLAPGTKITAVNHSTGLLTIDTPTTAAAPSTNTGTASGVIVRTLGLTGLNTGLNTLSATLSDAANGGKLGVTKSGGGTWVLAGNNTYSGATVVSAGTLYINGTLANSAITVNGGTLGGSSSDLGGGITVAASGTLAPGNSIGVLNAASVTLDGTLEVEYGTASIDLLNVTGLLDLSGSTVSFVNLGGSLDGTSSYVFATYGSLSGTFASGAAPAGYSINYNFGGGNSIALVAIPEPATALLGSLGMFGLLARRRRNVG